MPPLNLYLAQSFLTKFEDILIKICMYECKFLCTKITMNVTDVHNTYIHAHAFELVWNRNFITNYLQHSIIHIINDLLVFCLLIQTLHHLISREHIYKIWRDTDLCVKSIVYMYSMERLHIINITIYYVLEIKNDFLFVVIVVVVAVEIVVVI